MYDTLAAYIAVHMLDGREKLSGIYLRATISMQVSSKIRSDVGENYHPRKEYGVLACYRHDVDNYGGGRPVAKRGL